MVSCTGKAMRLLYEKWSEGGLRMTLQFSEKEVKGEIARLSEEYDVVRLVDPEECHSFAIGADCSYEYGPSCYSVWRSTNRCRSCTSLRALKTGMELCKTEVKDGDLYFITSRPIEILRADGTTVSCVMELIRIERGKGMKKDGHRAVLQEGFDKRAFAETLRVAMQNLPTGVVWFDMSGHCIYANSEAFRLFDVPDSLAKLEVILKDWFQEDALSSPEATVWLQQYGEKESPRSLQICRYPLNDGTGKDVGMYFLISDCTQDQKNLDLEHFGTMHDALTGIYNKYGFYRQARHVMDDNPHVEYLMVCLNFGDFKLLNGLYGMTKGNELLVRVGGMLRRRYGQNRRTAYGRIRADRFAMMIPAEDFVPEEYLKTVETVMHELTSIHFDLQIAIGICRVTDRRMPISVLCDRAFLAASVLKTQESNGFVWYSDHMMSDKIRDRAVLSRFSDALGRGEIQLYLQAQVGGGGPARDRRGGALALGLRGRPRDPARGIHPDLRGARQDLAARLPHLGDGLPPAEVVEG